MRGLPETLPAESFFLKTGSGERFCLYHRPHPDRECRGVLIYVHPFGDEMNKSRRMAAMQARAFAAIGFGVLQIDLFGCGDSSGEFLDARWNIWKHDLATARNWLENRVTVPVSLWGLRLGALLALLGVGVLPSRTSLMPKPVLTSGLSRVNARAARLLSACSASTRSTLMPGPIRRVHVRITGATAESGRTLVCSDSMPLMRTN